MIPAACAGTSAATISMPALFRALPTAPSSLARVHHRGTAHQHRRPPMPQLHQATRLIMVSSECRCTHGGNQLPCRTRHVPQHNPATGRADEEAGATQSMAASSRPPRWKLSAMLRRTASVHHRRHLAHAPQIGTGNIIPALPD
jgi:hypothetical protein